jgi:predicted alpha/beta hydrolase family esterase
VHLGDWTSADGGSFFSDCRNVGHIDNEVGVENWGQGQAVSA